MKKGLALIAIFFGISTFAFCQSVGIGTIVPNTSAQLDISSTVKGILIPRMNAAAIASISNPAKGLLVYDSSKNQLMVNMGTSIAPDWQSIGSKSGWNLSGNSGINPSTNFIGTTDATPFIIKVNNVKSGFIDSGTNNTGIGFRTLDSINTGTDNVALGYKSLVSNSGGVNNTAVGSGTLLSNTTGSYNTASGTQSMQQNVTGDLNAAYGIVSLNRNTLGTGNTAIGTSSLYWNTASYNAALGFESLNQNTTGTGNTGIGTYSLRNNFTGSNNTAVGYQALYQDLTEWNNTAVGFQALFNNNTYSNTAVGYQSLLNNISGNVNTAIGDRALYSITSGVANTGIGYHTLYYTTSSNSNIAVGNSAGSQYNLGNQNTLVGVNSDALANGLYNCTAIGAVAVCVASNQARIGNVLVSSIGGYANWTNFSDGRYKKNIQENVKGIDFIMKLHPVTYQLDVQGIRGKLNESRGRATDEQTKNSIAEKEKMIFSGFVAQEVEKAARESGYDFSGVDAPKNENDFYGLRYGDFVVPLVKTAQEQQVIIDKQQLYINDLQKRLQSLEEQVKLLLQSSTHKN